MAMLQCVKISQYGKFKITLRNDVHKLLILNEIKFILYKT